MSGNVLFEKTLSNGTMLKVVLGDITAEPSDAIVNAANSDLTHGGGVAGAISRKGGPSIQQESDQLAPVPVGSAVITTAGNLPSRYVIHTVGPRMGEGNEDAKLEKAIESALTLADEKRCVTLSIPAVSSGIFGYPKNRCAEKMRSVILRYFQQNPQSTLQEIRFCNYDENTCQIFLQEFSSADWPDS